METKSNVSQRVVITLPMWMYKDIKALSEFNRRPMSEEVRIAVENRLNAVKQPKALTPDA